MEDQIYIIIAKVLQGEASPEEQRELDVWLSADTANRGAFEEMKAKWGETDVLLEAPQFDATLAWEKVSARMQPAITETAPKKSRTIAFPSWLRYSSAIAAMLVIAVLVWNPFGNDMVRVAAADANKRIELPDHSVITLRKGSSFSYPEKFSDGERKVALEGEAFFEVARNEQQPFIIDAKSVSVKVLGTTFNVHCNENSADVAVATGRVQVASRADAGRTVILTRGSKVHYEDGRFIQKPNEGYESSWKEDTLSFNGIPFSQVIAAIVAVKDTAIAFDNAVTPQQRQQAITVSFRNESLEEMLAELCLIAHCRWEKTGATYLVRPK